MARFSEIKNEVFPSKRVKGGVSPSLQTSPRSTISDALLFQFLKIRKFVTNFTSEGSGTRLDVKTPNFSQFSKGRGHPSH